MRWHASAVPLLVFPTVALATSIAVHSLADRAQEAQRVVLVQVTSTQTVLEDGDPRRMKTVTEVTVGQSFKGEGPAHLQVIQLGGKSGLWESHIPGDAVFEPGETALVFLRCSQPTRCYLVALGAGALRMVDGQLLVPDLRTGLYSKQPLAAVVAQLQPPAAAAPSKPVKGAK
jgi:hypothetical protein